MNKELHTPAEQLSPKAFVVRIYLQKIFFPTRQDSSKPCNHVTTQSKVKETINAFFLLYTTNYVFQQQKTLAMKLAAAPVHVNNA